MKKKETLHQKDSTNKQANKIISLMVFVWWFDAHPIYKSLNMYATTASEKHADSSTSLTEIFVLE